MMISKPGEPLVPGDAVAAKIIWWERPRLGVSYRCANGDYSMHRIGPADWPILNRFERAGVLEYVNNEVKEQFAKLRERRDDPRRGTRVINDSRRPRLVR